MTIGADDLLRKFGSRLAVAEALLLGKIDSYEQDFVSEIVSGIVLEAAKFRVQKFLDAGTVKLEDDKVLCA